MFCLCHLLIWYPKHVKALNAILFSYFILLKQFGEMFICTNVLDKTGFVVILIK